MSNTNLVESFLAEINRREIEIEALRSAIQIITGAKANVSTATGARRGPKPKNAVKVADTFVAPQKKGKRGRPAKSISAAAAVATSATPVPAEKKSKGKVKKVRKQGKVGLNGLIVKLLSKEGMFMDGSLIANAVKNQYPDKDEKALNQYVSVTLSTLKKNNVLSSVKQDHKGNRLVKSQWGLPDWVNDKGRPIAGKEIKYSK